MGTASDNLNAAVAGGLGAVQDLLSKYIQGKFNLQNEDLLAGRNSDRALAQKKALMPLEWEQKQRELGLENQYKTGQIQETGRISQANEAAKESLPVTYRNPINPSEVVGTGKKSDKFAEQKNNSGSNLDSKKQNLIIRYQQGLNSDPLFKTAKQAQSDLSGADKLIEESKTGNKTSFNSVKALQARIMEGSGRLTDQDIIRYTKSGSIDRQLADKLSSYISGKPTDLTLNDVVKINDVLKQKYNDQIKDVVSYRASQMATNLSIPEDEAYKYLAQDNPSKVSLPKTETPTFNNTDDILNHYLKK